MHERGSGKRKHQRIDDEDVRLDLDAARKRAPELRDQPSSIALRCHRATHGDRIDPEHEVPLREQAHDVRLARWIASPIMSEADDLLAFDHRASPSCRSRWPRIDSAQPIVTKCGGISFLT